MKYIKTWAERCEEHPDHNGIVTERMIQARMQEEIDDLRAALAEPVQEPEQFDHGIGDDRFKVVRGAYWWHVLIGDGKKMYGKFHTQAGAEEMATLLLREFKNGAFVQHRAALAEPERRGTPMALSDYRLCDVCEGKAFYDSNLNYGNGTDEWHKNDPPFRIAGMDQYSKPEFNQKYGARLDYVGDWAVICSECAKTHKTIVVPIGGNT